MHTRPRLRHPLARALARAARALERAYLAHGTRMARTGGLGLLTRTGPDRGTGEAPAASRPRPNGTTARGVAPGPTPERRP